MSLETCLSDQKYLLMEGALGERLKREYHVKLDPDVAMASLIYEDTGKDALKKLWNEYIEIARKYGLPFLATTPTRRANQERVGKAGYEASIIVDNVRVLKQLKQDSGIEMYVGGLMGCKGDAYKAEGALEEEEAERFHWWQAELFQKAGVDFLYAGIMPALEEATGMARAMAKTGLPYIISFTIQKDGRLLDGTTITDAIRYIDSRVRPVPLCYMTNCVHPNIVREAILQPFNQNEIVRERFLGIQANTSPLTYEELDGSLDLKSSEPEELAESIKQLSKVSGMKIFGGCCGTDGRHMEQIAKSLVEKGRRENIHND